MWRQKRKVGKFEKETDQMAIMKSTHCRKKSNFLIGSYG